MFDWLFPPAKEPTGNYGPKNCNHRGRLYTAWETVSTTERYIPATELSEKNILSISRLERCYKCGEHRLVTHNLQSGTLTVTKQTVVDHDVA